MSTALAGSKAAAVPQHSKVRCIALLLVLIPLMFWHHAIATIPTPSDVRLEPGYLRWCNSQWAVELNTGRIVRTNRPDFIIDQDGKLFGFDYLNDTEQLAVSIDVPGTTQPSRREVVDLWGLPTILSGRYLILETFDQLRAIDLESEDLRVVTATVTPDLPSAHGDESAWLIPIRGTNRFMRDDFGSKPNDVTLYQIEPDQIRTLNSWRGMGQISCCNDRIYINRTTDKINRSTDTVVEVRSATDGSLLETIPFPTRNKINPNSFASLQQDWIVFSEGGSTEFVCFDLARKAIVDLPDIAYFPMLSERSSYVVLHRQYLGEVGEFLIYDRQKGTVVQTIHSPLEGGKESIYDQKHMLFTNQAHGITAALVDMTTGKEVQRWVPFAWTSWSSLLFCPLVLAWIIAWCKASARAHDWAWLDVVLVGGLFVTMAAYRVDTSMATYLLRSLIQFVGCYVVLKKCSVVAACSTLFLTLGLAQTAFIQIVGKRDDIQRWDLLLASAFSLLVILTGGLLVRLRGWSLVRGEQPRARVSVYDCMMLIAATAVFFSSLQATMVLNQSSGGSWGGVIRLAGPGLGVVVLFAGFLSSQRLFGIAISLSCIATFWIVGYRLAEHFVGDSLACMAERLLYPNCLQSQSFFENCPVAPNALVEAMLVGTFTPFLATIPFRFRGWTLRRADD